jgi:hypothetical protein
LRQSAAKQQSGTNRVDLDQVNHIGRNPESVELGLEDPLGMVERFRSLDRVDQRQHAGPVIGIAGAGKIPRAEERSGGPRRWSTFATIIGAL